MRTCPAVVGLAVAGLSLAGVVAPAASATDLSGSWEVSFDCAIYATATSFLTIEELDVGAGTLVVSTPPDQCGTVEVPGGIYPVAHCSSTPDPRDGLATGTQLDSPTTGYYTSDAQVADPLHFTFTTCPVDRIVSEHHFAGTIIEPGVYGETIRIAGTLRNGSLQFYDAGGSVCFSLPDGYAPDCTFEMRPNDVLVGTSVTVSPHAGVTVTFDAVTAPGTAAVTPLSTPSATVPGTFQVYTVPGYLGGPPVPIFYDVHTTATISGNITSCFTYRDENGDGMVDGTTPPLQASALKLLHAEDGAFVDRTYSLDTDARVICGRTAGLSQLVLGAGSAIAPPPPPPPVSTRDQPVSGRLLKLVRRRGGASFQFASADVLVPIPVRESTNDPRRAGAVLEVLSPGVKAFTLALPAGGWRMGTRESAYTFNGGASDHARVVLASTKRGHRLTVVVDSPDLPLDASLQTVAVRFTTGQLRSCTRFDERSLRRRRARAFTAGQAPAPRITDCADARLLTD